MPRRRPGRVHAEERVRRELRRRARRGEHDTIDGLSAKTMAQTRRVEVLDPRLHPGFTREALCLGEWSARSLSTWTVLDALRGHTVIGCGVRGCCIDPVGDRELLSVVVHALRRPQAHELRARIKRLDDLYGFTDDVFPSM
ncbi:hypothetical protein [Nocardiopsis suaedae]|uniref:Uncharacterized protein n=1 Tax=Nocardiopsis suaedae TaxID=3018444 RepID=A0ABT4TIZ4_9ACTN|nr:hypothetical protein [Nocardiopsis suaedae]MDA2804087.1 hypothetical protein [Nocardiopsis suaedae]